MINFIQIARLPGGLPAVPRSYSQLSYVFGRKRPNTDDNWEYDLGTAGNPPGKAIFQSEKWPRYLNKVDHLPRHRDLHEAPCRSAGGDPFHPTDETDHLLRPSC